MLTIKHFEQIVIDLVKVDKSKRVLIEHRFYYRYILLPIKKEYGRYSDTDLKANAEVVGEKSFVYGAKNELGKILGISPIFILNGNEKLVVTPFDHIIGKETYTPFSEYSDECVGRFYPTEYNAKKGISHSYVSLSDKKIYEHSDIFLTDVRIGINRGEDSKGLFKKAYVAMKEGFAFGTFITLDDGIVPEDSIVYMGQGKSLFTVSFEKVADNAEKEFTAKIADLLRDDVIYCLSDVFVHSGIYSQTKFAITDTKDYRAYTTAIVEVKNDPNVKSKCKITKDSKLYKLVRAGSILIPKNENTLKTAISNNNVEIIGYNKVVTNSEVY